MGGRGASSSSTGANAGSARVEANRNFRANRILDEKKKEQEENADYYFNEAEKIIKENDSHIPHLD